MNDLDRIDERIDAVGQAVKYLVEAFRAMADPDVDLLTRQHLDRTLSALQSVDFWWMKKKTS